MNMGLVSVPNLDYGSALAFCREFSIGMRNDLLPIGFAIHNEERDRTYSESWSYHIIGERLIAYKYGKTSEVQVQNIEKSLNTIIEQFEEMKKDFVFLLSENENQQN